MVGVAFQILARPTKQMNSLTAQPLVRHAPAAGDDHQIDDKLRTPSPLGPPHLGATEPALECLWEDAHLLAVNKPAGLLSVPGKGEAGRHNLLAYLQRRWPDAAVVHRLDMATSGLMLFARGSAAQRALSMAFEQRRVHKTYTAIVHGLVGADAGVVDAPLAADWPRRPRQMVDWQQGRPALTNWRVLARDAAAAHTRLELEPVTGRSHQLRVHLLHLGHPIVGDEFYAPPGPPQRLLLHATRLALAHPVSGQALDLQCPAPF
jgi:tRNA pseudouridine32 synthase / 23S rRNA pseudouridine746 synthase